MLQGNQGSCGLLGSRGWAVMDQLPRDLGCFWGTVWIGTNIDPPLHTQALSQDQVTSVSVCAVASGPYPVVHCGIQWPGLECLSSSGWKAYWGSRGKSGSHWSRPVSALPWGQASGHALLMSLVQTSHCLLLVPAVLQPSKGVHRPHVGPQD